MKRVRFITLSLLTVLMGLGLTMCCKSDEACTKAGSEGCNAQAAIDNIMTRTSIRAYTEEAVSDSLIETMLKAAMAAPTAVNIQPWRFVVIKERATLDSLAANIRGMRMAPGAPLGIAVCGDMSVALKGEAREYWVQDASAATENLLLAAHALDLGAVWCGVYPIRQSVDYVSQLLSLPDSIVPLNVVIIGHPAESPEPKDKWKPENIHYEKW